MILFDTSVLIDARDQVSPWHQWAKEQIAEAVSSEGAAANTAVVSEASVRAKDPAAVPALLEGFGMTLVPLPVSAAVPAARAFAVYLDRVRREGKATRSEVPLPDFFIGAHAQMQGWKLVTRDPDRVRNFFYITNRTDKVEKIVGLANGRCNQENVIEQLKNGVNAMRMPMADLVSNWAYMVIAALAWNLKAWYGLLVPNRERGVELVKMEFRRFLSAVMLLPCQVVRTARRVIYRILGYNSWLVDFFATWERLQRLVPGS